MKTYVCLSDGALIVDDTLCSMEAKPTLVGDACNTASCPARWKTSKWSSCSETCGPGKQERHITCMRQVSKKKDVRVRVHRCINKPKPRQWRKCNLQPCDYTWNPGEWTKVVGVR